MTTENTGDFDAQLHRAHLNILNDVSGNVVDDKFVEVFRSFYVGLFLLVKSKTAHLVTGDPFKERLRVFVAFLSLYFLGYTRLLVPKEENKSKKTAKGGNGIGKKLSRAFKEGTSRVGNTIARTKGKKGTTRNEEDPVDERIQQAKALSAAGVSTEVEILNRVGIDRVNFVGFSVYGNEILEYPDDGENEEARAGAQADIAKFEAELVSITQRTEEGDVRNLALITLVQDRLEQFSDELILDCRLYFEEKLGCKLNVESKVNYLMADHKKDRLRFGFEKMMNLQEALLHASLNFHTMIAELTGAEIGAEPEFNWTTSREGEVAQLVVYSAALADFWEDPTCMALDPFAKPEDPKEVALVTTLGQPPADPPTWDRLVQVAKAGTQ